LDSDENHGPNFLRVGFHDVVGGFRSNTHAGQRLEYSSSSSRSTTTPCEEFFFAELAAEIHAMRGTDNTISDSGTVTTTSQSGIAVGSTNGWYE